MRATSLLVISPKFHGYWRPVERAFTELGYTVSTYCYDDPGSIATRLRLKLGTELPARLGVAREGRALRERTRLAVDRLREARADVVLVVKGDELGDTFWAELEGHPRRALWLYDELRRTQHTPATLAAAGPIASYSSRDVEELLQRGLTARHVPLAYDPHLFRSAVVTPEVTFVGARYPSRETLLRHLAGAGVPVRAYGRDWSGHPLDRLRTWRLRTPAVPSGRDLARADAYAVMAGSDATLNIHGDQDGFTMRTFEACGVGAVQLVDRDDVWHHYEPGVEVAVFSSPDEAVELAERARRDRAWAAGLRAAGRARTLAEHTFAHRAHVLQELWA